MQLIFTDQYLNLLLLMNGLIILLYYGAKIKTKDRALKFGNYQTLKKVSKDKLLKISDISLFLRLLGFSMIIIGLSGPILVTEVPSADSSYVLAIDSSGTMTTPDIEPNRLEASKDLSREFVGGLPNRSMVGLVSYSGDIDSRIELTSNQEEIIGKIDEISLGATAGTATGDAVIVSSSLLGNVEEGGKEVILITDGTQNVGASINESIEFATRRNVTVNTIGIGSDGGDQNITVERGGLEGPTADFPNLEEENLFELSNSTGGTFTIVSNREEFETAFQALKTEEVEREALKYFIFFGLSLLMLEWFLSNTRYRILP